MNASTWYEANLAWLEAETARLRSLVEAVGRSESVPTASASNTAPDVSTPKVAGTDQDGLDAPDLGPSDLDTADLDTADFDTAGFDTAGFDHESPPALIQLAHRFGLTPFERDVLALVAAVEMDPALGTACATAHGDPNRPYPTVALVLTALPGASCEALAPGAPLRRWRLLELVAGPEHWTSRLRADERIVHYLRGLEVPDDRLAGLLTVVSPTADLVPSHQRLAERLIGGWASARGEAPVALLCGDDVAGKRAVAVAACAALGLTVRSLPATALPTAAADLDGLMRLLGREAVLSRCALWIDAESLDSAGSTLNRSARIDTVTLLAEMLFAPLLVSVPTRIRLGRRRVLALDVARPTPSEQASLWEAALGEEVLGEDVLGDEGVRARIATLSAQFDLDTDTIVSAGTEAAARIAAAEPIERALWSAGRRHARPAIEDLAHRLRTTVGWDGLVLPDAERRVLGDIERHMRHRARVHDQWGFAARSSRGLGIAALFVGPSGTGKTLAAEVLAHELDLDLYRVDLASVVSKYIGETEKNLKRVFDAADRGGAMLLFDEADALFGKRSEVKDSHDRHANIEVGYLLQRIEAYRGLAVLTTNLKDALDSAFYRRLRFLVRFPFPDEALRGEIWRRVFPPQTPTADLDFDRLARLGLAGGHIKSIALAAAFRAAEDDVPVGMSQVLAAARDEYAKLEKPFTEKGMEVPQ